MGGSIPSRIGEKVNAIARSYRIAYSERNARPSGWLKFKVLGISVEMRRKWLRLVVCLALAAFLVGNTHAVTMLAAHMLSPHPAGHHHDETHPDQDDLCSPCCPDCPDCPKDSDGSKCPCPGGCALCNVAKVPHRTPAICLPCVSACFESRLPCLSLIYTAPFSGRLSRPPRA
jgi:hypothetical protein